MPFRTRIPSHYATHNYQSPAQSVDDAPRSASVAAAAAAALVGPRQASSTGAAPHHDSPPSISGETSATQTTYTNSNAADGRDRTTINGVISPPAEIIPQDVYYYYNSIISGDPHSRSNYDYNEDDDYDDEGNYDNKWNGDEDEVETYLDESYTKL